MPYNVPPGNIVTYYPETNVLVPLSSVVKKGSIPTTKTIVVTVARVKSVPVAETTSLATVPA